jgi:hypothetical protein
MHTYKAPDAAIDEWLDSYPSEDGNYGHLLLEQVGSNDKTLVKELRPYFESAHADARKHFHELIGMDLHPEPSAPGAHAVYPRCLPITARRGLFGEVMAGLVTEHYKFIGNHDWKVPIFLFRHHEDVERYLFALSRDASLTRAVFGRFGSDFIAIDVAKNGDVTRYLAGEAKWRKDLTLSAVENLLLGVKKKGKDGKVSRAPGIWSQLNKDTKTPHGLRQLQRLLKEHDSAGWAATILSLDRALLLKNQDQLPRTNLVFIAGNAPEKKKTGTPWVEWKTTPVEYLAPHDLQVVELFLSNGEELIDKIYECLWT